MRTCKNHGDRKAFGRGMCQQCYLRWYRLEGGTRCPNHPSSPIITAGKCAKCYPKKQEKRTPEGMEKKRQYQREWTERNKDRLADYKRNWLKSRPDYRKGMAKAQKLREFDAPGTYDDLFAKQDGRCPICLKFKEVL